MSREEDRSNPKYIELMPPCFYCKHLIDIGKQFSNEEWTCKAYPEGIPYVIWSRFLSHEKEKTPLQIGNYLYKSKIYNLPDGKQRVTFDGDWIKV